MRLLAMALMTAIVSSTISTARHPKGGERGKTGSYEEISHFTEDSRWICSDRRPHQSHCIGNDDRKRRHICRMTVNSEFQTFDHARVDISTRPAKRQEGASRFET